MKKVFLFGAALAVFGLTVLMFSTSLAQAQEEFEQEMIIDVLIAATLPDNNESVAIREESLGTLWYFFVSESATASKIESAIIAAADDEAPQVRAKAAVCLDVMSSRESLDVLMTLADDESSLVRTGAVKTLVARLSEFDFAELTNIISTHTSNDLKLAAIRFFHNWKRSQNDEAESKISLVTQEMTPKINALIDATRPENQSDHTVRRAAVKALSSIGGEEVTMALIAAAVDEHEYVRAEAATALASRQGDEVFSILVKLAGEEGIYTSDNAIRSLTKDNHMGSWQDDRLLETLRSDENQYLRVVALNVIANR